MIRKYIADPVKCMISAAVSIFLLLMCVAMLALRRPFSLVLCFGVGILYALNAIYNGMTVEVGPEGVVRTGFLRKKTMKWNEIAQVGVCSTTVFMSKDQSEANSLYIYFSDRILEDEKECFSLILRWPPSDEIYLQYTQARMKQVQTYWDGRIHLYNTGKFIIEDNKTS